VRKIKVGVLFGGRSAEHEVSLRSAASVIGSLDRGKYEVVPIKIRKDGRWELPSAGGHDFLEGLAGNESRTVTLVADPTSPILLCFDPSETIWRACGETGRLDVVFPVLHGTYGEDGTVQGLLELAGIPCVGASAAASALGMDKALMKSVFRQEGLPIVKHVVIYGFEWARSRDGVIDRVEDALCYPIFIKPANLGSSVGVSKVKCREAMAPALEEALSYDHKAIVEQGIDAREIELSVLGNEEPEASIPGEILPSREFYDYRAKYIDDDSELIIPAPLDSETTATLRGIAIAAFRALDVSGMARVDFLLDRSNGKVFLNELNTIPGFTSISMYPKLWEASGIPMKELVDRLIELALEKAGNRARLETNYPGAGPSSP
jgi:D-alanine-D-alanine ligase